MDWNQIERQWAAMARRIRADSPCANPGETTIMPLSGGRSERAEPVDKVALATLATDAPADPTTSSAP